MALVRACRLLRILGHPNPWAMTPAQVFFDLELLREDRRGERIHDANAMRAAAQENLASSVAALGTPPAAAFKLSVRRNGTEFATLTWAANGAARRSPDRALRSPLGTRSPSWLPRRRTRARPTST